MLIGSAVLLAIVALVIGLGLFIGGATNRLPGWCVPVGLLFMLGAVVSVVAAIHSTGIYGGVVQ